MMSVECFAIDYDFRLGCYVVTCRATYGWYIKATAGSEGNLDIQRDIIKGRKTYETLRADLRRGCVLPPVVLSVKLDGAPKELDSEPETFYPKQSSEILNLIASKIAELPASHIQIIDGLQRTNAIRTVAHDLTNAEQNEFLNRPVRFEAWLNIEFYSLAYRMLLLNAGQKPMSLKHQIEVLADSMRVSLEQIPGLEIKRGIDKGRRSRPGQFQLSVLAGAFQAWIQKQPNVDLRSSVTEQLLADEAIDTLGQGLDPKHHTEGQNFGEFVHWLVQLDNKLGPEHSAFLNNETVVHAMAAAVASSYAKPELKSRCQEAMKRLLEDIATSGAESGFGPDLFTQFRTQIDPKKQNVGEATRDLVYRALSEFIISGGTKSMPECWTFASTYLR